MAGCLRLAKPYHTPQQPRKNCKWIHHGATDKQIKLEARHAVSVTSIIKRRVRLHNSLAKSLDSIPISVS